MRTCAREHHGAAALIHWVSSRSVMRSAFRVSAQPQLGFGALMSSVRFKSWATTPSAGSATTASVARPGDPRVPRAKASTSPAAGGPSKDRYPPLTYDPANPRRRLAVLVDATLVSPDTYFKTVEPAINNVGVPLLIRIFAPELSPEWGSLVSPSGVRVTPSCGSPQKPEAATPLRLVGCAPTPIEHFRVERFIPVRMQIEADANHILEHREQNMVEALCFVTSEMERTQVEDMAQRRFSGCGVNQYILDELGMSKELLEDGRSVDGAQPATPGS